MLIDLFFRSLDDNSELESQPSEVSLSDTMSTGKLETTGEQSHTVSPLVESTMIANNLSSTDTNTDTNTGATDADTRTDPNADTKSDANTDSRSGLNADTRTDPKTDTKSDTNTDTVASAISATQPVKRKYPKFVWSHDHWSLFKRILNSIQSIIDKWNE